MSYFQFTFFYSALSANWSCRTFLSYSWGVAHIMPLHFSYLKNWSLFLWGPKVIEVFRSFVRRCVFQNQILVCFKTWIPELDTLSRVLNKPCVEAIQLCLTQSFTIFSIELKHFSPALACLIVILVADSCDPQSTSTVSIFLLCIPLQSTKVIFVAEFT